MRDRANKFNDNPSIEDAWWDELEKFEYQPDDIDTAECAELADELLAFKVMADSDPSFDVLVTDWHGYVLENSIWLPLEQSCHEGVLLPPEQIAIRMTSCPLELSENLWYFLGHCPVHVKHHLALQFSVMVRIDRARRINVPDWRPNNPPPRPLYYDTVFFQPPKLKCRNYARQ